ncbi:hypothetical protein MMC19_004298 [Ptychographa xylographoides]|nr:hypothetical protein [Ptychographa xylographoides]
MALTHLQSGLDILGNLQATRKALSSESRTSSVGLRSPEPVNEDLIHLFQRLDIQAAAFLGTRPPQLELALAMQSDPVPYMVPTEFNTVEEARIAQERLTSSLFLSMSYARDQHKSDHEANKTSSNDSADLSRPSTPAVPTSIVAEYNRLTLQLQLYEVAIDTLIRDLEIEMSWKDIQGAIILKIHLQLIWLLLWSGFYTGPPTPALFGEMMKGFNTIITLSRSLIYSSQPKSSGAAQSLSPSVSLDIGIVGPLYHIAMKCPDKRIRVQAIQLLQDRPRREGLWDGITVAKIAQRTMDAGSRSIPFALRTGGGVPDFVKLYGLDQSIPVC